MSGFGGEIEDVYEVSGRGTVLQIRDFHGKPGLGKTPVQLPDGSFSYITVIGVEETWTLMSHPTLKSVGLIIRKDIDTKIFPLVGGHVCQGKEKP